ncbi:MULTISPECIES: DMT family transporter [Bacillus]|jgi:quaternary ammonium compound-resistance protein SugE|uniref:Multidrug efflux SMR transporter n=4 Tax=Bacillus amyloliquefaciens group TaxID=1938374 RepID=A7Z1Y6_BACVZ|nr:MULTISPECIES: multidrug efflux SMR transporter [Bacillus]AIU76273.1 molecular chaperone [Bacillus subtilis]SLC37445.1 quaternary ammonium compound-resistance protein SugE [Mycobacteroides abscessus subsp. massiliense]ABS73012.1 multidrug efflux SMR transporter [Bacillus velezensis FZB42]AFJ60664.1 small multidrug resistance protein, SMR family [Bacillus velezensis YAU B9601-Y2]AGZ55309.1 yvdR [Bacillus amyloliquefaciens CC178]
MAWLLLFIAGAEEVVAAVAMKHIDGFKKKWPLIVMVTGFMLSFFCLSGAMQVLPTGVAYAAWTGMGSIGVSAVGILWFKEKFNLSQLVSLGLILIGVIGLKLTA